MADENFRSGRSLKAALLILGMILIVFAAQGFFLAGGSPEIDIKPAVPAIGRRTPLTVEISERRRGLTSVRIELVQGGRSAIALDRNYPPSSQFFFWGAKTGNDVLKAELGRNLLPYLAGGTATIRVTAGRAGTWLRHPPPAVEEVTLPVSLIPPSLQVTSTQTYIAQGGCEVVTYQVGESAIRDGVRVGSWWFPGYPLPGGGKQDRFALFAIPYDMNQPGAQLVAEDSAGNEAARGFIDQFFPKSFRSDDVEITDAFLNKVVPEILSQSPELTDRGNTLDNYLAINRELRQINAETIKALAGRSQREFLWNSPFYMMPNGQSMAAFADRRSYRYQGRVIDNQTHLGYDLAVTKRAPVPASNSGIVVFAKFFGIYGNAVVIDHGYGLQTIYGHLSSISVKEGQHVAKAEILGRTGETGLAGGDHLHFSTLLQGLPVNPTEWWDGHWIQDRIARKLGPAFPFKSR
jgi:murein DD-endopeptidase MepM/ murein hydrolase activator NlpD